MSAPIPSSCRPLSRYRSPATTTITASSMRPTIDLSRRRLVKQAPVSLPTATATTKSTPGISSCLDGPSGQTAGGGAGQSESRCSRTTTLSLDFCGSSSYLLRRAGCIESTSNLSRPSCTMAGWRINRQARTSTAAPTRTVPARHDRVNWRDRPQVLEQDDLCFASEFTVAAGKLRRVGARRYQRILVAMKVQNLRSRLR